MEKTNVRRIDTMSVQEIIDEVGLNVLNEHEVEEYIFENKVPREEINTVFNKPDIKYEGAKIKTLSNLIKARNEYEKIRNQNPLFELLKRNADKVNKEKMILITLYNTQLLIEEKENDPTERVNVERWRESVLKAIKLIEKENIMITDIDFKRETPRLHVINSNDVIKCIKDKRKLDTLTDEPGKNQKRRFEKINEEIPLNLMVGVLFYPNIQNEICTYPECGERFIAIIVYKAVEEYKKEHPEYTMDFTNKGEVFQIVSETSYYNDILFSLIKENCKYIDLDKLLLIIAHNTITALEVGEVFDFQGMNDSDIKDILRKISKNLNKSAQAEIQYNGIKKIYNLEGLKKDLSRFSKNGYIKLSEIQNAKKQLISNKISLDKVNLDVLACIDFTPEEFKKMAGIEENLIFLISIGFVDKKNIKNYIKNESYSEPIFKAMVENELLTYDDTMKLLENGSIEASYIENLENNEWINQLNEETKNQIRELSIIITNEDQKATPDDMKKFNFYASIYKQININGKSNDEIKSTSNELIGGLEENLSEEILKELYQYGIINLEAAVDWGMDIEPMILNNSLKPSDFKDLYTKGIITKERIKFILKGNSLSYEEKLDLIYSTFDGQNEEEEKLVDELLEELGIQKESSYEKTGEKRKKGEGKHFNKYVVDAHTRWRIISAGDKDYSRNFLPREKTIMDGHRVFLLLNRNEVIIEKMHQKTKESKKDAYGYATYIMSSDVFFENIDAIIENGQVNRTELRRISEDGQAIKLNHDASWGDNLKEHFEIDETQPELNDEIDKAIKKYRECKERI